VVDFVNSFPAEEDADGDGNIDVNEDANGNGALDEGEDLDGDGFLDTTGEDADGDGKIDPMGYEVRTGSGSIYLDYDGNQRIGASVSDAVLKISEFVYLAGDFAFEKGPVFRVAEVCTQISTNTAQFIGALTSAFDSVAGGASYTWGCRTMAEVRSRV
jgi:hypothetical protein